MCLHNLPIACVLFAAYFMSYFCALTTPPPPSPLSPRPENAFVQQVQLFFFSSSTWELQSFICFPDFNPELQWDKLPVRQTGRFSAKLTAV